MQKNEKERVKEGGKRKGKEDNGENNGMVGGVTFTSREVCTRRRRTPT